MENGLSGLQVRRMNASPPAIERSVEFCSRYVIDVKHGRIPGETLGFKVILPDADTGRFCGNFQPIFQAG